MLAPIVFTASCASPPGDVYIPRNMGSLNGNSAVKGMVLNIRPSKQIYMRGDLIEFMAVVENVSQETIWVPKKLEPTFIWHNPRGERDGFLPQNNSPTFFDKSSAVKLEPGEKHSITKTIKTHYFRFDGIMEFMAILDVPENTNPALEPFWDHRIKSNSYGVLVSESRREINRYLDGDEDLNFTPGTIQ